MRPTVRLLGALVIALAAGAAPTGVALACSCGFPGYADAIAGADVAFIGTVVAENEPDGFGGGRAMPQAMYAFDVARSKAPMESPYELSVTFGDGANCGFDMSVGEEYVVIASEWEGTLTTNLCDGTALTEHIDPGELGRIEHALAVNEPGYAAPEAFRLDVPVPLVVGAGALLVVGLLSLLAFRRAG